MFAGDRSVRRVFLAVLLVVFVLLAKVVVDHFQKETVEKELVEVVSEKDLAYQTLDSMETVLEDQIEQVTQLGGEVAELKALKETLVQEKIDIRNKTNLVIGDLKQRVAGYAKLLSKKDEEIVKLKEANEVLLSKNTELQHEKVSLNDSISSLKDKQDQLAQKVEIASRLKAEKVEVMGLSKRGKEYRKDAFRNRHLKRMKVRVRVAENDIAPSGQRTVYMRIIHPSGEVIFDVTEGVSGSFVKDDREMFYSATQSFLYEKEAVDIDFTYEKKSEYDEGTYSVELYTDGYLLGTGSFVVK